MIDRLLRKAFVNETQKFCDEQNIQQTLDAVQAFVESVEMPMYSNCCWALGKEGYDSDTGVCGDCGEHTTFEPENEE